MTYLTIGITIDVLILPLNNTKNSKKDPLPWYCPNYAMERPFSALPNKGLKTVHFGSSKTIAKSFSKPFGKKTTEKSKTFRKVSQLFDQSENSVSCDYHTPYEVNKIKVKQEDLSLLQLNILSLSAYIDDLKNFLSELWIKFDIICICASRLSQKNPQTANINVVGYNIEQAPTESSVGVVSYCIYLKSSPINGVKTYKSIVSKNLDQCLLNFLFQTNKNLF